MTGVSIDRVLSDGFASRWDFVELGSGTSSERTLSSIVLLPPPFDELHPMSLQCHPGNLLRIERDVSGLSCPAAIAGFHPMTLRINDLGTLGVR